jgi:hypothetical protein
MFLSEEPTKQAGSVSGPGNWLAKPGLAVAGIVLLTALLNTAQAEVIEVFDHDFEIDPPNFQVSVQEIGEDATGSFMYGDVGGSRGLIFIGTYLTKVDVPEFEYANGVLSPLVPTFNDYHLYPAEVDGIRSISVSIDTILEGLPSDNGNGLGAMGLGLQLWQVKDGQWDIYEITQTFTNTTWEEAGWTGLTAEDFMRENGTKPDFSPTAAPIAFGLFVGIGYRWVSGGALFISTSARVDNWRIEADVGLSIFSDGFEE